MRKQSRIPSHLIIGAVAVILLVLLLKITLFNNGAVNYEEVIAGDAVTQLNVRTNTGNVIVTTHQGDSIRVYLTGEKVEKLSKKYKLKVKEKGNELFIEAKKKSKLAQGFIISIELPEKQYELLQVQAEVANIEVNPVSVGNYSLKTSVGNIVVNDVNGIMHANTQVGNINLQFQSLLYDATAKTDVGNIVVTTIEVPEALQTSYKTSIGTTAINLPNIQDGSIGIGGPLLTLKTDVGDISVLLADNEHLGN